MEHSEGSPWFWKIFGGAIIGLITLLLTLIVNNLGNNITSVKGDMNSFSSELHKLVSDSEGRQIAEMAKIKDEITSLRTKIAAFDEFRELIKDKMKSYETTIKEKEQQITEIRDRLLKVEEKVPKS